MPQPASREVARTTLAVLFIGILIAANLWILRPFLTPLLWGGMIVITTWPFLLAVERRLWHRRGLAVAVLTLLLLLVMIIPCSLAAVSIAHRADEIVAWANNLAATVIPQPPAWVATLPVVGEKLAMQWQQLAATPAAELSARLAPYARDAAGWLMNQAGSVGTLLLQFLLTVVICAVLYGTGEQAASLICRFARRLAGSAGEDAVLLAAKAVRGLALGVVVTALLQALLGGLGLALAGIPATVLLTAVLFVFCVAQIGPAPLLLLAVGWLFWKGEGGAAWGLLAWTVVVSTIDTLIRPMLIRRGADLSLLLIFAGVIGGLVAFGVIGLFIGPVLLAVTHTLLQAWLAAGESAADPAAAAEESP